MLGSANKTFNIFNLSHILKMASFTTIPPLVALKNFYKSMHSRFPIRFFCQVDLSAICQLGEEKSSCHEAWRYIIAVAVLTEESYEQVGGRSACCITIPTDSVRSSTIIILIGKTPVFVKITSQALYNNNNNNICYTLLSSIAYFQIQWI